MAFNNNSEIYVKTFFNPSLFWFVYRKDIQNINLFNDELNKTSVQYARISEPEVEMKIIVKYENTWVRAELVHTAATNPLKRNSVCWLTDFGIFTEVVDIYELPKQFQFQPAFVKKAMLYAIKPNKKIFNWQTGSFVESFSTTWQEGVTSKIRDILGQRCVVQNFVKQFAYNDFIIGDIVITSPDLGKFCLTDRVAGLGLAEQDDDNFKTDLLSNDEPEISLQTVFESVGYQTKTECGTSSKKSPNPISGGNFANKVPDEGAKLLNPVEDSTNEYMTCCSSVNNSDSETGQIETKRLSTGRGKITEMLMNKEKSPSNKETEAPGVKNILSESSAGRGFIKSKLQSPLNKQSCDVQVEQQIFEDAVENEPVRASPVGTAGRGFIKKLSAVNKNTVHFDDNVTVLNKSSPKVQSVGRGYSKTFHETAEQKNADHCDSDLTVINKSPETLKTVGRGFSKMFHESAQRKKYDHVDRETTILNKSPENVTSVGRGLSKMFHESAQGKKYDHVDSKTTVLNKSPENITAVGRGISKLFLEAAIRKTDENNTEIGDSPTSAGRGIIRREQKVFKPVSETNLDDISRFDDALTSTGRGFAKVNKTVLPSVGTRKQALNTETELPFTTHKIKDQVLQFQPAGVQLNKSRHSSSKSDNSSDSSTKYETASSDEKSKKIFRKNFRSGTNAKRPPEEYNSSDTDEAGSGVESSKWDSAPNCLLSNRVGNSPMCGQSNSSATQLVTGRCECMDCKLWRNNDMVFQKYQVHVARPKPKRKTAEKPAVMFKTSQYQEDNIAYTRLKLSQQFENDLDMLLVPRLLVQGKIISKPMENVENMPFNMEVKKRLRKLRYAKLQRIQTYTWPTILRGDNVFIVNGPRSGKTMSYVPAFCHFMLDKHAHGNEQTGPLALVLCPGVDVAEDVYTLLQNMLDPVPKKKVALAVPPLHINRRNDIVQNALVLVSTPCSFITLLKEKIIKIYKLNHVVLECASELFELFPDQLEVIFGVFQKAVMKRPALRSMQMIVVSQEWSHPIENFANTLFRSPLICIGSYLEAAFYGRADISVQFIESSAKCSKMIDIVAENCKVCKTVILYNEFSEMQDILNYLETHGINFIAVHKDSSLEDIKEANLHWSVGKSGAYRVLVCTDDVLSTSMFVVDASVVVQYSLPATWTQFAFRFSTCIDNYKNPFVKDGVDKTPACKMNIFVDESNTEQFLKMVQLLKRMECNLSDNILRFHDEYLEKLESCKITDKIELCKNIKLLGTCQTVSSCEYRHALSADLDLSSNLPKSGIIRLKVLHVESVTTFCARIVEYTDATHNVHTVDDKYAEIAAHMIKLTDPQERIIMHEVNIDDLCAVEETEGIFRRCKIFEITKHDIFKRALTVLVKLIDTGAEITTSVSNLFVLPVELKVIPPQAIEVYVANLGAPDKDTIWSYQSAYQIMKELQKSEYENANCYFTGRIKLQLNNAIWVDNLTLKEYLENGTLTLIKMSVRSLLLKNNLAEVRPEHLERLYDLCKKYHFDLPDYSLPVIKRDKPVAVQAKPMWAHLENFKEYNLVHFFAAQSPDRLFVRLCSSEKSFVRLKKDIEREIRKPFYPTNFTVVEGQCYLAKDTIDYTYHRVLVTNVTDGQAECLFVDFGDNATVPVSELKFLTNELIEQLPFQIIECELWGIKPKDEEWAGEVTDVLYEYALEPDSEYPRFLQVKVMLHENPLITGYKKYSVILINTFGTTSIINKAIAERGFAELTENFDAVDLEQLSAQNVDNKDGVDISDSDMAQSNYNGNNNDVEEVPRNSDDEESDEYDFQCTDLPEFLRDLIKKPFTKNNDTHATKKKETTNDPNYNTMKALPAPGYSTPKVHWHQTDTYVVLKIQLPNVTVYEIKVLRKRILSFKTEYEGTTYRLDLNLYANVKSDIEHGSFGLYIRVKLMKQTSGEWKRLVSGTERVRHITYNVAALHAKDDSDDELIISPEKIRKCKEFRKEQDNNDSFTYEFGSDVDYSVSDIESDQETSDF